MKRKRIKKGERSKRVREERRDFYVYYLRRPDKWDPLHPELWQPFYVGKGCNGRLYCHRWEAIGLSHKPGTKTPKIQLIHKLWKIDLDFIEEIMFDNLTEQEAFDIEISAIAFYGRINNGTGILTNLTDGGDGPSGRIVTAEERVRISNFWKEWHKNEPADSDRLQKISKTLKIFWEENPDILEAKSEKMRNTIANRTVEEQEIISKKCSETWIEKWKDPKYRAEIIECRKDMYSEDFCKKISDSLMERNNKLRELGIEIIPKEMREQISRKLKGHPGSVHYPTEEELIRRSVGLKTTYRRKREEGKYSNLVPDNIREIRTLRANGALYGEIASKFGISQSSASDICHMRTWVWVE